MGAGIDAKHRYAMVHATLFKEAAMNIKTLQRLAAAFVLGSLATSAVAEGLGEHPAVIVARTWNARGIDPNTFIVLHPAAPQFFAAAPTDKADKVAKDGARTPQAGRGG
jgi:hypothetical protein